MGFPALAGLGALAGRRAVAAVGAAGCALAVLTLGDVARHPVVPGANDNLSGVAALVAVAERLRAEPVPGLGVLLVSCGAEEVLQGGIHGFAARHLAGRDPGATWVLNLDTVGSPRLAMLEGEGQLWMEEYPGPSFRDVIAREADRLGIPLMRGLRARSSTDAVVPARAGLPTATLISVNAFKALSNYHQPTDTLDRLDLRTVGRAASLTEAVARALAGRGED
jgi:Zn-dependent M28 family amino/carboxypeptidase